MVPGSLRVTDGTAPRSTFPPPDALADLLAATTNAEGKGQIKGCRAEDIDSVLIEAAGFGLQVSELGADAGGGQAITLKPAGRLTGRVQADDPSSARGLEVMARTLPQGTTRPAMTGRRPRDNRCRRPLRDRRPSPPASSRSTCFLPMARSSDPSFRPASHRARQDHRGHDPDRGPAARADRDGPGGRPQRPAHRRRPRVPVRRFRGANRSPDRRGRAIRS